MKRILVLLISGLFAHTASYGFDKTSYYGTWVECGMELTIASDTICVAEEGGEGYAYTYTYDPQTNTFSLYDTIYGRMELILQFPIWNNKSDEMNVILCDLYGENYEELWLQKKQ